MYIYNFMFYIIIHTSVMHGIKVKILNEILTNVISISNVKEFVMLKDISAITCMWSRVHANHESRKVQHG